MESKTGKIAKKLLVLNISDLIFFLKPIKNTNLQEIKKIYIKDALQIKKNLQKFTRQNIYTAKFATQ